MYDTACILFFLLHYVYIIMTFNIHFKKFISNLFNIDFKYCPK